MSENKISFVNINKTIGLLAQSLIKYIQQNIKNTYIFKQKNLYFKTY